MGTGVTLAGETEARQVEFNIVSPGFFTMLGMPIVRGRGFTKEETQADTGVMVVTESTARRLGPGGDAVGKTLRNFEKKEYQGVGVVMYAQASQLGEPGGIYIYMPAGPEKKADMQLVMQ